MGGLLVPPFLLSSATNISPRSTAVTSLTLNAASTIYGDTAASGVLKLRGTSNATVGRTDIDKITLFSDSPTLTAATGHLIRTNGTITLDGANIGVQSMVMFDATVYQKQSNTLFGMTLFNMNAIYQNEPNTSGMTLGAAGSFVGQAQIQAVTYDTRQEKQWSFMERFIFGAGSGTAELFNPQWYRFYAANQTLGNLRTGGRVLNHVSFYADTPSIAGTGILHNNTIFGAASQTTGRDFNYFIKSGTGLSMFGDDVEVNSLGTKGLVLHPTTDTRYRYTAKDYTGALQSSEVAFDPAVDIDWQGYYRADSTYVGGVADGADITRWHDKSGQGRDLTLGAGTDVPIWENSLAVMNNQPAVEFTAANSQSLEFASTTQTAIFQAAPYTFVAVVSLKTVTAAMRIANHTTGATRGFGTTATPNWDVRMSSTLATGGTPAANTLYYIRIDGAAGSYTMYATPIATGAEVSVATTATAAATITTLVVGAHKSATPAYTTYLNGYVGEIAWITGDFTAHVQYSRYLEYLNTRYGFSLTTASVSQSSNTHSLITSSNITAVGNVGTGEDDLMTYSLPSSYLSANGDSVPFEAAGTIANNANQKRIKIKFGATTILDTGAAGIAVSTAYDWVARGRIVRTGAATQDAYAEIRLGSTLFFTDFTSPTETLSGAVTFKLTGETNAASNNDVVQELMIIGVDGS